MFVAKHRDRDARFFRSRIRSAAEFYGVAESQVRNMTCRYTGFLTHDHAEEMESHKKAFGVTREGAIRSAILRWPTFVRVNGAKKIKDVQRELGVSQGRAKAALLKKPRLADADLPFTMRLFTRFLGAPYRERIQKAILRSPRFAGRDLAVALERVQKHLGVPDRHDAIRLLLAHPAISQTNLARVVSTHAQVLGVSKAKARASIRAYPPLAGLDLQARLDNATNAFGPAYAERTRDAFRAVPSFAARDHQRIARNITRVGRLVGLTREQSIEILLANPILAGYAPSRHLALIDSVRTALKTEGLDADELNEHQRGELLRKTIEYAQRSPYAPHTRVRLTVAKRAGNAEPSKFFTLIQGTVRRLKREAA